MKRLTAFLIGLCIAGASIAADKGGPPQKIDAAGNVKPAFNGLYLGAHGSIATFEADNLSDVFKRFGVVGGYDIQRDKIVFGASASYDFGIAPEIAVGGRLGYLTTPLMLLYAKGELRMDGDAPKIKDSILAAGVGLETYLMNNLAVNIEVLKDVKGFGGAKALDESYVVRAGVRIRLNGFGPAW